MYNDSFERMRSETLEYMKNKNRTILEEWCKEIGYKYPFGYYNELSKCKMIIYTKWPGLMIGRAGCHIDLLKDLLKKEFSRDYTIEFVEIRGDIVNLNYDSEE